MNKKEVNAYYFRYFFFEKGYLDPTREKIQCLTRWYKITLVFREKNKRGILGIISNASRNLVAPHALGVERSIVM